MKLRIFLLSIIPYLIILIAVYFVTVPSYHSFEKDIYREIARQEYNRLNSELTDVIEKQEDYEEILKAIIEQYRMGNHVYAWLIDRKGSEIAFSQNKRYMEPQSLLYDKKNILPYIIANLPSGENYFETKTGGKYCKYSEMAGTDYILVVIGSIPMEAPQFTHSVATLMYTLMGLFLLGLLISLVNTELLAEPIIQTANYALRVSIENEPQKPKMKLDPETELIVLSLEKIKKTLAERQIPDLNSLTNLPGNYALEKQLFDAIDSKEKFAVGAINVYNFSSYNHKFGFKKGDSVIRFMGSTIQSAIQEMGEKDDFVSHLSGDRFVFITKSPKVEEICKEMIRRFDAHVQLYYDDIDRARGYILSKNRRGEIQKFPIIRLTIAVVTNYNRPLIHPLQIAHITSEILQHLKSYRSSSYLIDRRLIDRGPLAEGEDGIDGSPDTSAPAAPESGEKSPEATAAAPEQPSPQDVTEKPEPEKTPSSDAGTAPLEADAPSSDPS